MSTFALPSSSRSLKRIPRVQPNNGISIWHRAAQRGVILVGVAVVLGIILLQVVDKAGGGGGGNIAPPVTNGSGGTTVTTVVADAGRPPGEVRVLALNGSGVNGAAATLAHSLQKRAGAMAGGQNAIAGTANAPLQNGTTVACRAKFEKEATELAVVVGNGAVVGAFPVPDPAGSENADCVVIRGR